MKYAYAYAFEYLAMCNEFIENFADQEEISVVSLGCGTMLEYWALANVLNMREKDDSDNSEANRKVSWPAVRYLGIDTIKWNYSMETEARGRDLVTYSQESFEDFFERPDNKFNTYDVYFFPKSISEFTNNAMKLLLKNLSEIKKDTIYFCITLRKVEQLNGDDVRKVQMIIDHLEKEKTGFRVKDVKCITDREKTIGELNEKGVCVPQDNPCEGCKESVVPCELNKEQRMTNTKYICDLIIKCERR